MLELVGGSLLLFASSLLLAYAGARLVKILRYVPDPVLHRPVRIRGRGAIYRSRYEGRAPAGWCLSAPLQRDCPVPLRRGEELIIEAPFPRGVAIFRTVVLHRIAEPHLLIVRAPERLEVRERRSYRRCQRMEGQRVLVNGKYAYVVDLGRGGLRALTNTRCLEVGDEVKVELPASLGEAYGAVLDVRPIFEKGVPRYELRIVFESESVIDARQWKVAVNRLI